MVITNEQELEDFFRKIIREELRVILEKKPEKLHTFKETMEILRVSKSTLRNMEKGGKIRANRMTTHPRFSEAEINRVLTLSKRG